MEANQVNHQPLDFNRIDLEKIPRTYQDHYFYRFLVKNIGGGLVFLARNLGNFLVTRFFLANRQVREVPGRNHHIEAAAAQADNKPEFRVVFPASIGTTKYMSRIKSLEMPDKFLTDQNQLYLLAITEPAAQHNPAIALCRFVVEGDNIKVACTLDLILSHVKSYDRRADRLLKVLDKWDPDETLTEEARNEAQVILQRLEYQVSENLDWMEFNNSIYRAHTISREEELRYLRLTRNIDDPGCMLSRCIIKHEWENVPLLVEKISSGHENIHSDRGELMKAITDSQRGSAKRISGQYLKRASELNNIMTGKLTGQNTYKANNVNNGSNESGFLSLFFDPYDTAKKILCATWNAGHAVQNEIFVNTKSKSKENKFDKDEGEQCCACFDKRTFYTLPCCSMEEKLIKICSTCFDTHIYNNSGTLKYQEWVENKFKIPCPNCHQSFLPYDFLPILKEQTRAALCKMAATHSSKNSNNRLVDCPECPYFTLIRNFQINFRCNNTTCAYSNKLLCALCCRQWSQNHACESEAHKTLRFKTQNLSLCIQQGLEYLKLCPECEVLIQRQDGCRLIDCANCRFSFCWNCTQSWKDCTQQDPRYHGVEAFTSNCNSETKAAAIERLKNKYTERLKKIRTQFQEEGGDITTLPVQ